MEERSKKVHRDGFKRNVPLSAHSVSRVHSDTHDSCNTARKKMQRECQYFFKDVLAPADHAMHKCKFVGLSSAFLSWGKKRRLISSSFKKPPFFPPWFALG